MPPRKSQSLKPAGSPFSLTRVTVTSRRLQNGMVGTRIDGECPNGMAALVVLMFQTSSKGKRDCHDLIGRVVSITEQKVVQVNSNPQRLIDFVIEDSRGSRFTITIWEEHVDSVLPYYNVDLAEPLIVILQLCRAWVNKDGNVRISSSYIATKILFNYECPEFLNFKERYCILDSNTKYKLKFKNDWIWIIGSSIK
nr:replication protein A 70 kDa DNA-binding subunit D-like [Ipomoea batatas]